MSRTPVLVCVLAFVAVLGGLTLTVAIREGPDVLTVISLLVLAMFAFGVVGALRQPPGR